MNDEKWSLRLADTILKRYPNPDRYPYRSWSYSQGYMLWGMEHLWKVTKDKQYYNYIYQYCDEHVMPNGEIKGFTGCSMDDIMTGSLLVWAYVQTKEERFALACHRIRKAFDDYPRTREGGFLHDRYKYQGEMWVDGVFMGQMFLCRYGAAFHEDYCFFEMVHQLELIHQYCNAGDGLLLHAYSEEGRVSWADKNGRSCAVWSEGLGWYALILSEILSILPEKSAWRKIPELYFRDLLIGLKKYQDVKSGLWFQIVNKPDHPGNWCDTSGSAMFLYAILYGLQAGKVNKDEFIQVAKLAWNGLITRALIDEGGFVDIGGACNGLCVQNSEKDYLEYPQVINAQEGVCSFLWASVQAEYSGLITNEK